MAQTPPAEPTPPQPAFSRAMAIRWGALALLILTGVVLYFVLGFDQRGLIEWSGQSRP